MLIKFIKEKKKMSAAIVGMIALVAIFAGVLPSVFAKTAYYLTEGAVELNGTDDGSVTINFNTPIADTIYSVEGNFTPSVANGDDVYFVLTELTPGGGVTPSSNTTADGRILWIDSSWENGMELGEREPLWSATYTVDKNTPAGTYEIKLTGARVASESEDYDTANLGDLTTTVIVTRSSTPVTKPSQVVTFKDGEGDPFTELDMMYGDDDFTVTMDVTTGDGEITEFHPNDGESEHPGSIVRTDGNKIVITGVGNMDVCAWVSETPNYAASVSCFTVHVSKRSLNIASATIEQKTFDGTSVANVSSIGFHDRDLGNDKYTLEASFDNANVGENKPVSVRVTLVGDAADHYTLNSSTFNTTGTIVPLHLVQENVEFSSGESTYVFDPDGVEPGLTVTANIHGGTSTLVINKDYTVTYDNNNRVGTGHAYVAGMGNFTTGEGSVIKDFTITAFELSNSNLSVPNSVVDGHILTADEVSVTVGGRTLTKCVDDGDSSCDYKLTITNNTGTVGDVIGVTVEGRNNYTGSASGSVNIVAKLPQTVSFTDVTDGEVTATYGDANFTHTATTDGDGAISYRSSNGSVATVDSGTGSVTIVGVGEAYIYAEASETDTYAYGETRYHLVVGKKTVSVESASVNNKVYDGTNVATVKSVALSDSALVYGTDFTVSEVYFPNYGVGTHDDVYFKVTLDESVRDRYQFTAEGASSTLVAVSATITAFELTSENATAVLSQTEYYYSGSENKPTVTVTVDLDGDGTKETTLVAGTDFTVTYFDNTTNAGNKTATVSGAGNYAGGLSGLAYTVLAQPVTDVEINVTNQTYTGEALEPVFTATGVISGERVNLTEGVHYEVIAHDDFVNAGSYQFGIASSYSSNYYTPITNATFVINAHALAQDDVTLEYTTTKYNGSEKKPSVTVKIGDVVVSATEYEVVYNGDTIGSVNADATPTVTITAKEGANISGSVELSYTIVANGEYDVVRGGGQAYVLNSDGSAEFEIDADYSLFEEGGAVYVDEMLVDPSNYNSWSSSTVISLKPEFMKTLALGEHKLKVLFNNGGEAETTFTISEQEPEAPQAADTGVFTGVSGGVVVAGFTTVAIAVMAGAGYMIVKKSKKA